VILKIGLKDALFATESGQRLIQRGIYFGQALPASLDAMHDNYDRLDFRSI
jgi:hypothetical protein